MNRTDDNVDIRAKKCTKINVNFTQCALKNTLPTKNRVLNGALRLSGWYVRGWCSASADDAVRRLLFTPPHFHDDSFAASSGPHQWHKWAQRCGQNGSLTGKLASYVMERTLLPDQFRAQQLCDKLKLQARRETGEAPSDDSTAEPAVSYGYKYNQIWAHMIFIKVYINDSGVAAWQEVWIPLKVSHTHGFHFLWSS